MASRNMRHLRKENVMELYPKFSDEGKNCLPKPEAILALEVSPRHQIYTGKWGTFL